MMKRGCPTVREKMGKDRLRNRGTLEFLGTWEQMYKSDFKVVEFNHFKMHAGLPSFVLSPGQWIKKTSAIGMYVRSGRYGGTYDEKGISIGFFAPFVVKYLCLVPVYPG